jgi:hypothetical protein
VREGGATSAKLVFDDGEPLDAVAPSVGDVGAAKRVSEVNKSIG